MSVVVLFTVLSRSTHVTCSYIHLFFLILLYSSIFLSSLYTSTCYIVIIRVPIGELENCFESKMSTELWLAIVSLLHDIGSDDLLREWLRSARNYDVSMQVDSIVIVLCQVGIRPVPGWTVTYFGLIMVLSVFNWIIIFDTYTK